MNTLSFAFESPALGLILIVRSEAEKFPLYGVDLCEICRNEVIATALTRHHREATAHVGFNQDWLNDKRFGSSDASTLWLRLVGPGGSAAPLAASISERMERKPSGLLAVYSLAPGGYSDDR